MGAAGIQAGTLFAFCAESGICPELKQKAIAMIRAQAARVFTDPVASPTGFPFKVLRMEGTLSEAVGYAARTRFCDLGYLRHVYRQPDGTLGYRCPAEPIADYLKKGGLLEDTVGRKCICNGLPATVGLGQVLRAAGPELPLMTTGDDVAQVAILLDLQGGSYTAADAIHYLLGSQTPA